MPIFVSRFAPDRSLVGNFLSTRGRREKEEKENEPQRLPQQQDSLELSDRQTTEPSAEKARATIDSSTPVTATRAPETQNTAKTQDASPQTPNNLSISEIVQFRKGDSTDSESSVAAESTTENTSSPLVLRLGQILGGVDPAGNTGSDRSEGGDFLLSIQQENGSAALNATVERLGAFLTRLDALTEPDVVPAGEAAAEGLAETPEVPVVAPEQADTPLNPVVVPQPETVPREIQEQDLQKDLQAISSGLQADAAIESRRNVETATQNAQRTEVRSQRQEVRDNQNEIRSLQSERRQLQQDVQKTDQAIRQMQNRNSQLQNSTNSSAGTGTSLDILAQ